MIDFNLTTLSRVNVSISALILALFGYQFFLWSRLRMLSYEKLSGLGAKNFKVQTSIRLWAGLGALLSLIEQIDVLRTNGLYPVWFSVFIWFMWIPPCMVKKKNNILRIL